MVLAKFLSQVMACNFVILEKKIHKEKKRKKVAVVVAVAVGGGGSGNSI